MKQQELTRREVLRAGVAGALAMATCRGATAAESVRTLSGGPHLLLDDSLVAESAGLRRELCPPQRLDRPVIDSARFGVTQPYLTVVRDEGTDEFRLWYNRRSDIWHTDSTDGITWREPRQVLSMGHAYGCSLVDDGPGAADSSRRYQLANWQATREKEDRPGDDGGMYVAFSPDGLTWTPYNGNPVLPTWPEDWPNITRHGVGDTIDVWRDPLLGRYVAGVKVHALPEDGYAPAPKAGRAFRRLVGLSTSEDFVHWERPERILVPDAKDDGLLEFYGMGAVQFCGDLRVAMVRVLRDDLPCDENGPKDGIGYTALAISRDGRTWTRDRGAFFDRSLDPAAWDHAMAWITAAVPVGEEVYLYYGGYKRGHKIEPETERQIGLAKMRKDRFVAFKATEGEGLLRTAPLVLSGEQLTLNVDAEKGEVRVRLLSRDGKPIDALGASEAPAISGDHAAAPVRWSKPLSVLNSRPVRLELSVRDAALFGFSLQA